jgi:penicillin-binding protein 2
MGNPFIIQDGRFGGLRGARSVTVLDESPTSAGQAGAGARRFIGLTIPGRRFAFAGAAFTLAIGLLLGRAAQLQIVNGSHYAALAEKNRVRAYTLIPPRGVISDRFGTPLVENVASFQFVLTFADLPKDVADRKRVIARAADLVGARQADIDLVLADAARNQYEPFVIKKAIPYEAAMRLAVEEASLPGFNLEAGSMRSYPSTVPTLSHVLGYTGKISADEFGARRNEGYRAVDDIGKAGIERSEESRLRGTPGSLLVEVNNRGRELSVDRRTDPVPGQNLTLTVDLELQRFVESRVGEVLERLGLTKASVVALDPRDGSVRALVSEPTYDSNAFAGGIEQEAYAALLADENRPLFNRAVAGEFPPGSTFKPYVAYTALADGLVGPSTSFLSTGGLRIGQWFFPDWKAGGHGITDVRTALAWSVNTYFYIVGGGFDTFTGLGVEHLAEGAARFGFGSPTGIRLPSEASGFLPSKEWKEEAKGERWYVGDTYHLAIGQGDMLATPLQLAVANATIANGGTRYVPRLVERAGDETVQPVATGETLDASAIQIVREGMRKAVTEGSARFLLSLALPTAGKTGTAQAPGDVPTHAWFEGFGPYGDPTLAVVVLIENGGEGSSVAVPIARDIFEWWFANRPDG